MTRAKKSRQPPAPQPPHLAAGSSRGRPPSHPTTRREPAPAYRLPSSSGEEFNFGDPNEPSSDEQDEQPATRRSPSLASIEPAAGSAAPTRPASPSNSAVPAAPVPVAPVPAAPGPRTNSSTALDITHFFERGSRVKETRTVCKLCRYVLFFDIVTAY
jgi:hypothetical protein